MVRVGAVGERELTEALHWQYHFDADSYADEIRADLPAYDALQDELAGATGSGARRILELGTGTGETARRLLARHPDAVLVGIDENERMLAVAARRYRATASTFAPAGSRTRCRTVRSMSSRARCACTTCPGSRRPICFAASATCSRRAGCS